MMIIRGIICILLMILRNGETNL